MGNKPRGAPKKPFVRDPERFAIAIADALMALGASSNDAFATVAVQMLGKPVAVRTVGPRRKRGRGLIAGGIQITYQRRAVGGAATFDGKASTLRRKAKAAERDPSAAGWRKAMGRAYVLALAGNDHDAAIIGNWPRRSAKRPTQRACSCRCLPPELSWPRDLSPHVRPESFV